MFLGLKKNVFNDIIINKMKTLYPYHLHELLSHFNSRTHHYKKKNNLNNFVLAFLCSFLLMHHLVHVENQSGILVLCGYKKLILKIVIDKPQQTWKLISFPQGNQTVTT